VGAALYGRAPAAGQRTPAARAGTSAGADPQRARGAHGGAGLHGEVAGPTLGCAARGRVCRVARRGRGNRTALGRQPLAALSGTLPAPAAVSGRRAAFGKSFRPTASRTCRTHPNPKSKVPSASRSPLEAALEADSSTLQKTGHFYFALTRTPAGTLPSRPKAVQAPPGLIHIALAHILQVLLSPLGR
jgi:hypothetical protein